jgi:hypothetical protein
MCSKISYGRLREEIGKRLGFEDTQQMQVIVLTVEAQSNRDLVSEGITTTSDGKTALVGVDATALTGSQRKRRIDTRPSERLCIRRDCKRGRRR